MEPAASHVEGEAIDLVRPGATAYAAAGFYQNYFAALDFSERAADIPAAPAPMIATSKSITRSVKLCEISQVVPRNEVANTTTLEELCYFTP